MARRVFNESVRDKETLLKESIHKQDAEYWAKYSICPPAEVFKDLLKKLKKDGLIYRDTNTNKYYVENPPEKKC